VRERGIGGGGGVLVVMDGWDCVELHDERWRERMDYLLLFGAT
jgi:hypothetical protein